MAKLVQNHTQKYCQDKTDGCCEKGFAGIRASTKKTRGKEQEKAHRDILRAVLKVIATVPKIGLKRDELPEGLRSFPVGNHIAYYIKKRKRD
jgi:plasmid stabilization system protein ParE